MGRSKWKFKFFSKPIWRGIFVIKKYGKYKKLNYKEFFQRSSNIPNVFRNYVLKIHKGLGFRILLITKLNVGMKLGEFSFTRKPFHFPLRKKKSRKFRF